MSEHPGQPTELQRALMERARAGLERDREKPPKQILPRIVAAAMAIGLVLFLMTGFSNFLTSVQKVLELVDEEQTQEPGEPMPVYVVPGEDPATPAPPVIPVSASPTESVIRPAERNPSDAPPAGTAQ
jgi:hypothetical protein